MITAGNITAMPAILNQVVLEAWGWNMKGDSWNSVQKMKPIGVTKD